jgi:hypothetical protein
LIFFKTYSAHTPPMDFIKRKVASILLMHHSLLGLQWSTRSSPLHSRSPPPSAYLNKSSPVPDTTSTVYPDRLIRPLPKRRIRDRLSVHQTEQIVFPSVPNKEAPLFSFPYPEARSARDNGEENHDDRRGERSVRRDIGTTNGAERTGGAKVSPRQGTLRHRPQTRSNNGKPLHEAPAVALVDSANSSIDGDEGFENTNNKKKRRFPQHQHVMVSATNLSLSTMSADMANLGISSKEPGATAGAETVDGPQGYNNSGSNTNAVLSPSNSNNSGLSGPGRARYGRAGRASLERRPLTTSTNALNFSGSARSRLSPSSKGKFVFFVSFFVQCWAGCAAFSCFIVCRGRRE